MARTNLNFTFEMSFEERFKATVHKASWTPVVGEILVCKKDTHQEAAEYNSYTVGIYCKSTEGNNLILAGHVPIELSRVIARFLGVCADNSIKVKACSKRKHGVGLILPGLHVARSK